MKGIRAVAIPVLFSAVSATRRERVREGVLLKTLGATRAQIARILLAEYSLLGLLGGVLLNEAVRNDRHRGGYCDEWGRCYSSRQSYESGDAFVCRLL